MDEFQFGIDPKAEEFVSTKVVADVTKEMSKNLFKVMGLDAKSSNILASQFGQKKEYEQKMTKLQKQNDKAKRGLLRRRDKFMKEHTKNFSNFVSNMHSMKMQVEEVALYAQRQD